MHLVYENNHFQPLENGTKVNSSWKEVYVTEGCVELGVGEELFHMDQGDIGFIFPKYL